MWCHLVARMEQSPAIEKCSLNVDTRNDFKRRLTLKPYDLHSFLFYYVVGTTKDYKNVQNH